MAILIEKEYFYLIVLFLTDFHRYQTVFGILHSFYYNIGHSQVQLLNGFVTELKAINPNCYNEKTKDGNGICYEYDTDDRKIKIHYPDGGTERMKYDANGNIVKKIQPEQYDKETDDGAGYVYDYDCVNRLVQITAPDGVVIKRYIYDIHGNIIKEIDGEGYISADNDKDRVGILYQYNAIGWLTEKREPIKQEEGKTLYRLTRYSYDYIKNMTKEMRYRDFQTEESADSTGGNQPESDGGACKAADVPV